MPLLIRPPRISDFGYDTITLEKCWPWYKGVLFIITGCVLAGCEDLFDGPPEGPRRRQPLIDFQVGTPTNICGQGPRPVCLL